LSLTHLFRIIICDFQSLDINFSLNGKVVQFYRVESAPSFGVEATRIYGELPTRLERSGKPIGPLDQMIAAHALSENTVLVTNNIREFQRVEGVMLENWAT
jgi:predicted nucleic acid-binding protein